MHTGVPRHVSTCHIHLYVYANTHTQLNRHRPRPRHTDTGTGTDTDIHKENTDEHKDQTAISGLASRRLLEDFVIIVYLFSYFRTDRNIGVGFEEIGGRGAEAGGKALERVASPA